MKWTDFLIFKKIFKKKQEPHLALTFQNDDYIVIKFVGFFGSVS